MTSEEPPVVQRFGIPGPPAIVFLDSEGNEREDLHLINKEVGPERLLETLKKVS